MRAALLEAQGEPLRIVDDVEIREPQVGEVRVAVKSCSLCHSDLSIIDGVFPAPFPIVVGHEAAGVVDKVGPGVDVLSPGDRVVLTAAPPCGQCYWCVRGEFALCVNAIGIQTNTFPDGTTGLSRCGQTVYRGVGLGAFAEFVVTPSTGAVKVPPEAPLDALCEEGATVLVLGLGGIGLSVVQGARIAGASRIIVSDPVKERREAAARFGATDLLDPSQDDVIAACKDLTQVGVDYAFETAGRASLVQAGMEATRNGGTTICLGAPPLDETIEISPAVIFTVTEKKLCGCVLGSASPLKEIPRLVALWQAGLLDLEGLITARRPLDEINEATADLREGRGIRTVMMI